MVDDLTKHILEWNFAEFLLCLISETMWVSQLSSPALPSVSYSPELVVTRRPLGHVGSSDHRVVFTTLAIHKEQDRRITLSHHMAIAGRNKLSFRTELDVTDQMASLPG